MIRFLAPTLLLAFGPHPAGASEPDKKEAELKWAREVASDFLDAAFQGKLEQAENLIDTSLKNVFAREGEQRLREWLNNSIAIRGFHAPVFRSEEIAPDRDEASFAGTFKDKENSFRFSLRVVKDREKGKWRVSYFRFEEVTGRK